MKSIIQKASTIQRAIEDAWNAAGKPQEFSIRILELPQKGFLGFTKHPAKIALVFEEQRAPRETRQREHKERSEPREVRDRDGRHHQKGGRIQREQHEPREPQRVQVREQREPREQREQRSNEVLKDVALESRAQPLKPQRRLEGQWSEDLVISAQKWLTDALALMGKNTVTFTTEIQSFNLLITFNIPLTSDETKEKHLFASLSTLMMASLKREYRRALRGHKIVIGHA